MRRPIARALAGVPASLPLPSLKSATRLYDVMAVDDACLNPAARADCALRGRAKANEFDLAFANLQHDAPAGTCSIERVDVDEPHPVKRCVGYRRAGQHAKG